MNLPIDTVPNSRTLRFRWRQTVDTPFGARTVEHEGALPPICEDAVKALLDITKQLTAENIELRRTLEEKTTKLTTSTTAPLATTRPPRRGA